MERARTRRSSPDAFKLEAVAAVQGGGRSVSEVAAELGLPDRLVRSWLGWAENRPSAGSGAPVGPKSGRPGHRDRAAAARARPGADGSVHLKAGGAHLGQAADRR